MPKQSFYEKEANKDDCTMLECPNCHGSTWWVFIFKDGLEFHCKNDDEVVIKVNDLPRFCLTQHIAPAKVL